MGKFTSIAWTDHTFNPWWGCQRISPGCERCYAETFSRRVGLNVWGPTSQRRFFGDKHWAEPLKWNRAAETAGERRRVFCASMADVFEDRRDLGEWRERLWDLIAITPHLDWLLLTKRPENMARMIPWGEQGTHRADPKLWPNVWLGTTAEDQKYADERIPDLLATPAAVRFVSVEPMLGPVALFRVAGTGRDIQHDHVRYTDALRGYTYDGSYVRNDPAARTDHASLAWVIVGGESGPRARPFDLAWARNVVAQCRAAGTACFVKQLGAEPIGCSVQLRDRKGGDWSEWPEDLRVREFPKQKVTT